MLLVLAACNFAPVADGRLASVDAGDGDAADGALDDAGASDLEAPDLSDADETDDVQIDATDASLPDSETADSDAADTVDVADVDADAVDGDDPDAMDAPEAVDAADALDDGDEADATDAVVADTCAMNGCGGCEPLEGLGARCGPCWLDEVVCDGTDSTSCSGATACGTVALGQRCSRDADCESGSCSEESDGTANDRCVPRLFAGSSAQVDFAYVPPGSFQMGSPEGEVGYRDSDEAQVSVTLTRALAVMRTEVTQGQWQQATGSTNPSFFSACGDACPVEQVDWYSAAAYANWLSENDEDSTTAACYTLSPSTCADSVADWADGDTDCTGATFSGVTCTGYRLLTEAEWEYSARAGTTTATYWSGATSRPTGGNLESPYDCDPQPNLEPVAWYCGNDGGTTHAVASLPRPNAWGLYDMLGNVWEWTTDWDTSSLPGGRIP